MAALQKVCLEMGRARAAYQPGSMTREPESEFKVLRRLLHHGLPKEESLHGLKALLDQIQVIRWKQRDAWLEQSQTPFAVQNGISHDHVTNMTDLMDALLVRRLLVEFEASRQQSNLTNCTREPTGPSGARLVLAAFLQNLFLEAPSLIDFYFDSKGQEQVVCDEAFEALFELVPALSHGAVHFLKRAVKKTLNRAESMYNLKVVSLLASKYPSPQVLEWSQATLQAALTDKLSEGERAALLPSIRRILHAFPLLHPIIAHCGQGDSDLGLGTGPEYTSHTESRH
jgi:hypothetical protein